LGLSVSFMIIQGYGGKLEAESTVGEGTTITVRLPLRQPLVVPDDLEHPSVRHDPLRHIPETAP
jgi:signal transduction histidine kinase